MQIWALSSFHYWLTSDFSEVTTFTITLSPEAIVRPFFIQVATTIGFQIGRAALHERRLMARKNPLLNRVLPILQRKYRDTSSLFVY